jgi:hypothetical protein
MQSGVVAIAAVLWLDMRLAELQRRQWLLRNLEAALQDEGSCLNAEDYFTRAA